MAKKNGGLRLPFLTYRIEKNDLARSLFFAWRGVLMGCYFRLHSRMKKIFFWFAVFAMSLLVMVQPARAAVESVPPTGSVYTNGYHPAVNFSTLKDAGDDGCAFNGRGVFSSADNSPPSLDFGVHCTIYPANAIFTVYWNGVANCPAATPAYTFNSSTRMCERTIADCPAFGSQADAYWIATGTVPNSIYTVGNGTFCKNSCQVKSVVSVPRPAGYPIGDGAVKLVDGVRQFYSFREYMYTGQSCSAGDAAVSAAATIPASDSCASNQSMIQMGARIKCIDPSTGVEVSPNSASAVAAAKTLADAKIAAQIAAAGSAVAAAGGSASDVAAARSVAAGAAAAGGGAASNTGFAPDDPMNAFCVQNPQATICKEQTAGNKAVGTAALSGLYTDGALIGGKTVSSVIGGFKTRVLASGVGAAVGGFFTVNQAAGACPVWSINAPMIGALTFDFYCQSTFQNLLPWIRSVLLLIFSVIAFRIAIL